MNRATPTEVLEALTILAQHGVDIGAVHRTLGTLPEVARRTVEFCPAGVNRDCRVFGITWWNDGSNYASYRVCTAHEWAGGPLGPLGKALPIARESDGSFGAPVLSQSSEDGIPGRAVVIIPEVHCAGWAAVDGERVLDSERQVFRESGMHVLTEAALWFDQLLASYEPSAVLISGRLRERDDDEDMPRLAAMGIEIRTRKLGVAMDGYAGLVLLERLVGALHTVADLHCPGEVYRAEPFATADDDDRDVPPERGPAFDIGLRTATSEVVGSGV